MIGAQAPRQIEAYVYSTALVKKLMSEKRSLIFVALGDSLTRGFILYNICRSVSHGIPYTSHLDKMVVTELSKRSWDHIEVDFLNLGINGDTTDGMRRRLERQVAPLKPDYVIIWGGINDLYWGTPLNIVMENLKETYDKTIEIGARPLACTLTSVLGFDQILIQIQKMNALIMESCIERGIPVADLYGATSNEDGKLKKAYSSDEVHLSGEGYAAVASTIFSDMVWPILEDIGT